MYEWLSDEDMMREVRNWETTGLCYHVPILYDIAIHMSQPNILEIGVGHGRSTRALLAAARERGGRLTSVDPEAHHFARLHQEIRDLPFWRMCIMKSETLLKEWADPLDLLFIEGDRAYEVAKADFEGFSKFVKPDGFVVINEVIDAPWTGRGRVAKEAAQNGWTLDIVRVGTWTGILTRKAGEP